MTSQCVSTNPQTRLHCVDNPEAQRTAVPRADVHETPEAFVLTAELPGVKDESVSITYEQNVLTIEAANEAFSHEGYELVHAEFEPRSYKRSFTVRAEINRDAIVARLQDGVLTVTLPKAEPAKVQKISVNAA